MELTGKYVISSNGKILAESNNMITANGLTVINQYLANLIPSWAGSIAVGGLSSTSTASSTNFLQYEFFRTPVIFKSYRTVSGSNQLVLKATLDPTTVFQAYEIGLFPMTINFNTNVDNYPISDFSEQYSGSSAWYIGATPATSASSSPTPRMGSYTVSLAAGNTISIPGASTTTSFALSTSTFTDSDAISTLYYVSNAITSGSLTVYLADDTAGTPNVWTASTTVGATASGSYYTSSLTFATKPTNFTDNVIAASVQFAGTGTIKLDHIKFVTGDTKPTDHKLVSRTESASPIITKTYGQPMDIEYYLQVT